MARWKDIANIWKNVREVDLRPIRAEALQGVKIAIIGSEGSGRQYLADQLRRDPQRPSARVQTPILVTNLNSKEELASADLLILLVDPATNSMGRQGTWSHEWTGAGKDVLIFYNQPKKVGEPQTQELDVFWDAASLIVGSVDDPVFLLTAFVPAVMDLLSDRHLTLARKVLPRSYRYWISPLTLRIW